MPQKFVGAKTLVTRSGMLLVFFIERLRSPPGQLVLKVVGAQDGWSGTKNPS